MMSDGEYITFLHREWSDIGRLVLRDHGVEDDLEAIHDWVSWFIVNGTADEQYELILAHINHSLNLDIPFTATTRVRESLVATARDRIHKSRRQKGVTSRVRAFVRKCSSKKDR